ncbi:hypothetical protein NEIELOOT_00355 [Neisseria elongata subsp. glycolytica ATCC 29315]|uniref:Uncharacterized protein n=1 Tax=Neisseria elongata subsp. glycolytica ATCC 29315 TaxID=546263 RepID=D4DMT0_NEIEG|nr:hypothetical protein NEIELOOT_00355 [Neisseria elongata subsp. glycolytica ATCC 29315]
MVFPYRSYPIIAIIRIFCSFAHTKMIKIFKWSLCCGILYNNIPHTWKRYRP